MSESQIYIGIVPERQHPYRALQGKRDAITTISSDSWCRAYDGLGDLDYKLIPVPDQSRDERAPVQQHEDF